MKAKTIKALDSLLAALEEVITAVKAEADKSGSGADDEDTGEVSGRSKPAKAAVVSGKGKPARQDPDDDDDVDGGDDAGDDEDEDLPPAKAAVKGKPAAKTASKPTAKTAAKGKAKAPEADLDAVRESLTAVMNHESLGKAAVVKVLKKFGATKSAELEESDFSGVIKACAAALASVEDSDDGEDDDV